MFDLAKCEWSELHSLNKMAVAVLTIVGPQFPVQISVVVLGQYEGVYAGEVVLCSAKNPPALQ